MKNCLITVIGNNVSNKIPYVIKLGIVITISEREHFLRAKVLSNFLWKVLCFCGVGAKSSRVKNSGCTSFQFVY
jgi:hypothetical protein